MTNRMRRHHRSVWTIAAGLVLYAAITRPTSPGSMPAVPRAAAQPVLTATPGPDVNAMVFGDPHACSPVLRVEPMPAALTAGERITVTAAASVACPNVLDAAAVLVLVGSVEPVAEPRLSVALRVLGDALDDHPNTPLAVVDAAVPDGTIDWHDTPTARRAALEALAGRTDGRRLDGERWADALRASTAALGALPPTVRPVLVIVDARRPRASEDVATAQIAASVATIRDSVGRTVLFDLSSDGWMATFGRQLSPVGLLGFDSQLARDAATVGQGMQRIVDHLEGVVDEVSLQISWSTGRWSIVAGSAVPPPSLDGPSIVQWQRSVRGSEVRFVGAVVLESHTPGRSAFVVQWAAMRSGAVVARAVSAHVPCVHPSGESAAFCAPTPTSTMTPPASVTPGPSHTPSATVPAMPSRSPQPTATRQPLPTPNSTGRVWLPIGYG